MKILIEDIHKPLKIDGHTKVVFTIEIGDVFVNNKNEVVMLKSMTGMDFVLMDGTGKTFRDYTFLSDEWNSRHRFCGRHDHDFFCGWEDAMPLI